MDIFNMSDDISYFGDWLWDNQSLCLHYVINMITAVMILITGTFIAKVVSGMLMRFMRIRNTDSTVALFLSQLVRYALMAFTFVAALGRVGVETASVIAVIGAAGLAIGLALQGSLANFAAGVLLVMFRSLRVGEFVDLGGIAGTVKEIHIFSTTLLTVDNKNVVVPNGKVIAGNIVNYSREPHRRVDITIGVAYSTDIDTVKNVLKNVIDADARILVGQGTTVRLNEMGASSLSFVVRVWTTNDNYWPVYFDLLEGCKRALDVQGIAIPFPQLDVHLHTVKSPQSQCIER